MYAAPRVTDFGRIELYTHALPGSSNEVPDETTDFGGGGEGGFGLVVGLLGGVIAIAGRDGDNQPVAAVPPDEEEEKLGQK